jgi:hypothetical protein
MFRPVSHARENLESAPHGSQRSWCPTEDAFSRKPRRSSREVKALCKYILCFPLWLSQASFSVNFEPHLLRPVFVFTLVCEEAEVLHFPGVCVSLHRDSEVVTVMPALGLEPNVCRIRVDQTLTWRLLKSAKHYTTCMALLLRLIVRRKIG